MKNTSKLINKSFILLFTLLLTLVSCDFEYELPETGSIADKTPPKANFGEKQSTGSETAWKNYTFSNLSTNATMYLWNFGDGNTSTDLDATNTFPGEGTYTVTLTATDNLGVSNTFSKTIEVIEPEIPLAFIPTIQGANFEADSDKTFWQAPFSRVGSINPVMQTTTSGGYFEGTRGGKLPNSVDRLGYQLLQFTANTNYILTYKYRMKNALADTGVLKVSMVKALNLWNLSTLASNTIATNAHPETTSNVGELTTGSLTFNSGANTSLAILIFNEFEECYVDSFTINTL